MPNDYGFENLDAEYDGMNEYNVQQKREAEYRRMMRRDPVLKNIGLANKVIEANREALRQMKVKKAHEPPVVISLLPIDERNETDDL